MRHQPRLAAVLALACLVGCAGYTPQQIVEQGKQRTHESAQPPRLVAGCIARNLENSSDALTASVREGPEPGNFEVVLRVPVMKFNPNNATFRIAATPQGSEAIMFMRPEISDETTDKVAGTAFAGC